MILVDNLSGLGNRLKNLVSALRLGHVINDTVQVKQDLAFAYTFDQFATQTKEEIKVYTTWRLEDKDDDADLYNQYDLWIADSVEYSIAPGINLQYDNIKTQARQKWLTYFDLIKWSPYILEQVQLFSKQHDIANSVGVHIRSWKDDNFRKSLLHDTGIFINEMEKFSNAKFFVASDCDSVLEEINAIFKNQITTNRFPGEKHLSRNLAQQVFINAIIDMLLLSKCSTIIGTYQSSYSEIAWWFGQCRSTMIIPYPEHIKKLNLKETNEPLGSH